MRVGPQVQIKLFCLYKKRKRPELISSSAWWVYSEKVTVHRKRALTKPNLPAPWSWTSQPLGLWKNKCLLFLNSFLNRIHFIILYKTSVYDGLLIEVPALHHRWLKKPHARLHFPLSSCVEGQEWCVRRDVKGCAPPLHQHRMRCCAFSTLFLLSSASHRWCQSLKGSRATNKRPVPQSSYESCSLTKTNCIMWVLWVELYWSHNSRYLRIWPYLEIESLEKWTIVDEVISVSPIQYDGVLLKKEEMVTETHTHTEDRHCEDTQKENGHITGMMHLQVKEHKGLLANTRG